MKGFAGGQIALLTSELMQDLEAAAKKQDEEAVHKMRVSIRRYLQGISVFEECLPEGWSKKTRKALRPVLRRSSKVRDLDLALLFLKKHEHEAGVLNHERERAGLKLADALESGKWRSHLDEVPVAKSGKNMQSKLPPLAEDFFAAGRKAMKPKRTWAEMHEFRLAAKEFRYTLELFRPVFGKELEKRLEAVRTLQQFLGHISDAVSARKLLKDVKGTGTLREKLAEKADSTRKELVAHWGSIFDAAGELEKWKKYLKPQQKVRAHS